MTPEYWLAHEALADSAMVLPPENEDAIRAVCRVEQLTDETAEKVVRAATLIYEGLLRKEEQPKSKPQLASHLGKISKAARELAGLLANLGGNNLEALDERLVAARIHDAQQARRPPPPSREASEKELRALARQLLELESAARELQATAQSQSKGQAGGRGRNVFRLEALELLERELGEPVGRGGRFQRICQVVFDAVGAPHGVGHTIRVLLNERMAEADQKKAT